MSKHKRLIATIVVAISLLSIPGTVFAKMLIPDDIKEALSEYDVSSDEEVKYARAKLTEVANGGPKHVDIDVSDLIVNTNLKPINSDIELIGNGPNNKGNLEEKIKTVKAKNQISHNNFYKREHSEDEKVDKDTPVNKGKKSEKTENPKSKAKPHTK